ncbi:unnamed protein product [Heligmosomoides polygyrus]|uniref:Nuclear nucleic acid-binding protein C1D n=1 Tax=Heligmosomoides polygyrus TaxID=6339 RepID=A0A183FVS5_HELPZ|nr:unnamed protein product [Heligmosomoides polygyrus]
MHSTLRSLRSKCLKRLQKFDEALTSLEVALAPVLAVGFEDHMKRSALEMAQVDVMTMFVLNSLGWSLEAQRGFDPKDDVRLGDELRRLRGSILVRGRLLQSTIEPKPEKFTSKKKTTKKMFSPRL